MNYLKKTFWFYITDSFDFMECDSKQLQIFFETKRGQIIFIFFENALKTTDCLVENLRNYSNSRCDVSFYAKTFEAFVKNSFGRNTQILRKIIVNWVNMNYAIIVRCSSILIKKLNSYGVFTFRF